MEQAHGSWLDFLYLIKLGPFQVGSLHLPLFRLLPHWLPDAIPLSVLVALLLALISYLGLRRRERIPSGLQNALEMAVEGLEGLSRNLLGERGSTFAPFLGTLFLYILLMNLLGLIPGFKSPTTNLNVTLGLALIVFVAVQYYGIKENGGLGYLKHFTGDIWWLVPLILPVHVIGELVRPVSLALRLFGNVTGEETVIAVLVAISPVVFSHYLHGVLVGLPIPVAVPMMALAIFTGVVQALVFTLLAAAYLAGIMEHA